MTREEAIKICKQVRKYFKGGKLVTDDTDAICEALTNAIEALQEQRPKFYISKDVDQEKLAGMIKNFPPIFVAPGTEKIEIIREQRWIPVSERLPEMDGKYLITELDGCVTCDYFWLENGDWRITFPIAWMSLPEPYTEKRGD